MSTTPVSVETVGPWVTAHVPGAGKVLRLEKFGTGQSNPTWRVEAEGGEFVLRAKPLGRLLPRAHLVEREFRLLEALWPTPLPVPRPLAIAPDAESPIGRAFYVMAHVHGRVLFDPALPEMTREERAALHDAMNAALATLHELDAEALGLGDFGRPGNYFARQTARWTKQYLAARRAPDPTLDRVAAWLAENQPGDDGQIAIVHGDWRLDNMILAPEAPLIRAVIDWELATLGHPYADLAYQCLQWRLPHAAGMRGLGGLDRATLGIPSEREYVEAYLRRRGLPDMPHWRFLLIFSAFRLAAILVGVVRRAADGSASNPQAARRYAEAIPLLAAEALALIEGRAEA